MIGEELIKRVEEIKDEKARNFLKKCLYTRDLDEDLITDSRRVYLTIPYLKAIKSPAKNIPHLLKITVNEEEITFEQAKVIPIVFFKKRNFLVKTENGWDIAKRFVTQEQIQQLREQYAEVRTMVVTTFDVLLYSPEEGYLFINEGKGSGNEETTRRFWNERLFEEKRKLGLRAFNMEAIVKPSLVKNESYEYCIPVYENIRKTDLVVDESLISLMRDYIDFKINPKKYFKEHSDIIHEEEENNIEIETEDGEIPF